MKNKLEPEIEEFNPQGWMITFSDMVSLLLTFFVMLLAMSSLDNERLKKSFKFFLGALGPLEKGAMGPITPPEIIEDTVIMPQFYQAIQEVMGNKKGIEFIRSVRPGSDRELDDLAGLDVTAQERGITVRIPSTAVFEPGSVELQATVRDYVVRLCRVLRGASFPIRVEGHTDNLPIRTAKYPSNWDLSMARALGVVKVMQWQGGIEPERLAAVSYGGSRPFVPNDTAAQRAKNRRIEILILREKGEM